jgi:hypothetical protein
VKNLYSLAIFLDPEDNAINVRPMSVKQMPKVGILWRDRASIRMLFQAKDGLFESSIPFQGRC